MDSPCCSQMTAEALPPTQHKLKTSREGLFQHFSSAHFHSRRARVDDRTQRDANPYFIHLIWRTLWFLLPFATVLENKVHPLKRKDPQVLSWCPTAHNSSITQRISLFLVSPSRRNPNIWTKAEQSWVDNTSPSSGFWLLCWATAAAVLSAGWEHMGASVRCTTALFNPVPPTQGFAKTCLQRVGEGDGIISI